MMHCKTAILIAAIICLSASSSFSKPGDHRPHPFVVDPDTIDVGLPENLRIIGVDGPEKGWRAECTAERELEVHGHGLCAGMAEQSQERHAPPA